MPVYDLLYPIAGDGGGTITSVNVTRPKISNLEAVKQYRVDGEKLYMARLLQQLSTLSLAEAGRIDIADINVLLNMLSKL